MFGNVESESWTHKSTNSGIYGCLWFLDGRNGKNQLYKMNISFFCSSRNLKLHLKKLYVSIIYCVVYKQNIFEKNTEKY